MSEVGLSTGTQVPIAVLLPGP